MENSKLKTIYEDSDLLVIDKPAGINSDDFEKRAHRLDKDTSGLLLIAKNDKTLKYLQKQFKERRVEKKYFALINGHLKNQQDQIKTFLGRSKSDKTKQKVYLPFEPGFERKREAITNYRVLQKFKDYDLIEAEPKTGRKHQIRVQLAHIGHPVVGDKKYGFKAQITPKGLKRHFLHASYLKINLPGGKTKEFKSELPEELKNLVEILKNNKS